MALGTEGLGCPSEHLVEKTPMGLSAGTTPSGHPHRGLDLGRDKDSGWLALCYSEGWLPSPLKTMVTAAQWSAGQLWA